MSPLNIRYMATVTASMMVSTRKDVQQIAKMADTNASYLLELSTDGIHLHTLSATSEEILDEAVAALKKSKFLVH